jgi:hypothetical protein
MSQDTPVSSDDFQHQLLASRPPLQGLASSGEPQTFGGCGELPSASLPPALAAAQPQRGIDKLGTALSSVPEDAMQAFKVSDTPEIVLELSGEGVLDVPPSQRCIGPVSLGERPLLVGRRHQPELHQRAISKECLEFLSRDHFCVAYEGGEFWLLALTTNRIWRDRDGECPVLLARDDLVTLFPGDRILLGPGSEVAPADTVCRSLVWHFKRVDGEARSPTAPPKAAWGAAAAVAA